MVTFGYMSRLIMMLSNQFTEAQFACSLMCLMHSLFKEAGVSRQHILSSVHFVVLDPFKKCNRVYTYSALLTEWGTTN